MLDQNCLISLPYPRQNCLKMIPFTAANIHIAYICGRSPSSLLAPSPFVRGVGGGGERSIPWNFNGQEVYMYLALQVLTLFYI